VQGKGFLISTTTKVAILLNSPSN